MRETIDVRLRYGVTGSVSAAKAAITEHFCQFLPGLQEFTGDGFSARKYSADVNPSSVSGYRNYETFHCAMFLSNNRRQYEVAINAAKKALSIGTDSADPNAHSEGLIWLADQLETLVENGWLTMDAREEACKTDSDMLAHSLLSAALGRVNWLEIAEEWLSTAQEDAAARQAREEMS